MARVKRTQTKPNLTVRQYMTCSSQAGRAKAITRGFLPGAAKESSQKRRCTIAEQKSTVISQWCASWPRRIFQSTLVSLLASFNIMSWLIWAMHT